MKNIILNQLVTLKSAKGIIQRIVVEDFGDVITVTTAAELEAAQKAGRAPAVSGFPKSDLVATTSI
jgi:hypothetical protein